MSPVRPGRDWLWVSTTYLPFLSSFERLLLHAICQYMDLISASKCCRLTGPLLADAPQGHQGQSPPQGQGPGKGLLEEEGQHEKRVVFEFIGSSLCAWLHAG